MELKKNPEKDLRKQSGLFMNIGLVVALACTIVAFEWKDYDQSLIVLGQVEADFEEVIEIPPTEQPPPPPPVLQQPEIIEVEDEEEIEEIEIEMDVEVTEEEEVEEVIIEEVEEEEIEAPVFVAEQDALPPGGLQAWRVKIGKYCQKNYPERDRRAGVSGRVYVSFVIEKDGSLTDIKIMKGLSKSLDKVALDAIRKSGKWKAAKQGGRKVRLMKRLPIKFNI